MKEDQTELDRVEARIREVEPQARIDREIRHARDLEEARVFKRKQHKLKL